MDAPRTRSQIRNSMLENIEYIFMGNGSIGSPDYLRLDALAREFEELTRDIQAARQRRGR